MDNLLLSITEREYLGYDTNPDGKIVLPSSHSQNASTAFYLDCEMVITDHGRSVSLIAFGNRIERYKFKVKPEGTVIDYLTNITGIDKYTEYDMTLTEVIDKLKKTISNQDILIGHHMYNDLAILGIYHDKIIDTCMIYHHPDGPPHFYSLKYLANMYLGRNIQEETHCPEEDGLTTYALVEQFVSNDHIKVNWKYIGENFVPNLKLVTEALAINKTDLKCIYTRGSRVIGTNRINSDHDLIAICNETCNIVNGTLVKYGNIDICIYDTNKFMTLVQEQTIWALEAIYCGDEFILKEEIDYRLQHKKYRKEHMELCNSMLRHSIGYEASRKISSSKRHFNYNNHRQSCKHAFIAARFCDYGRQIMTYGEILSLKSVNWFWEYITKINGKTWNDFKDQWIEKYKHINSEFSKHVKKYKKINNKPVNIMSLTPHLIQEETDHSYDYKGIIREIQAILRNNDIELLRDKYMINIYESQSLCLLRYTSKTPNSKFKYVCRGLIFDKLNNWKLIAYPFNNFVSFREQNTRYILEKVDGSFACLYFHDKWMVSSSTHLDGNCIIGSRVQKKIHFATLFWSIFKSKGYRLSTLNKTYCYMFELITPDNPIIIMHDYHDLILLGVRNMETLDELDIYLDEFSIYTKPKIYPEANIDNIDPLLTEGFVIVGQNYTREKIKTSEYIQKSLMFPLCRKVSEPDIIKIIQLGEEEEFTKFCPQYLTQFTKVKQLYDKFIDAIQCIYDRHSDIQDRKTFALSINGYDKSCHKYMYALHSGKNLDIFVSSLSTKLVYNDIRQVGKII